MRALERVAPGLVLKMEAGFLTHRKITMPAGIHISTDFGD